MVHHQLSRRRFLQLSAIGAGGLALTACVAAPPAAPAPAGEAAGAGPYTGKFVILSAGNPDQIQPMIDAIEAANPGVEVEWRGLTSERYTELFAAAEVAGDQIDIMDLNGQDLRRYAVGNKLKDLDDLTYLDRFRPVGLQTYTIKGTLWAAARGGISGFPFLVNKKILDTAGITKEPETYADLLEMAPRSKTPATRHLSMRERTSICGRSGSSLPMHRHLTTKPVEMTYKILQGEAKFTDPDSVAALEILNNYARDGMFIDGVNSLDSDGAWLAFSQGKGAFWYEHSWRIGLYRDGDYPSWICLSSHLFSLWKMQISSACCLAVRVPPQASTPTSRRNARMSRSAFWTS